MKHSQICKVLVRRGASLVVQTVKRLPAMQETQVQFLGQEDPLEKEMETHSSILAWRSPWTMEPGGLQSIGSQRVGHDRSDLHTYTHTHTHTQRIWLFWLWASLVAQRVKCLPTMWETQV